MKILVCGGRDYDNKQKVFDMLNFLHPAEVITGGATGADSLADQWAMENTKIRHIFPADWAKHGKSAGPIRNALMLQEGQPDLVIAFPGGKGTENLVKGARILGIEVNEVE